ncbi:FAD-binding oxidoreductase [Salinadaptatus halalkaliphilus]|uniref:FAD-binding oxidoreductase n=1 Tax=Salinadaptatus halalkaliphilus TaxID=2419781 RepID=A0A4S3TNQ6_9EURY|nr:FAD-dependent oxidoreductase [Salinadaptatus halalkaliphilus]THE65901.1 FAD-binding oxidoreductase [Salinadaptatus halalkaliphilus]
MTVVVVGGGIVGMASAYELADRGVDVIVCENGSIGNGSTERAVGGIRAQFSTPATVEMSLASMAVWDAFEERFGETIDYRRTGYLFLARSSEDADALEAAVATQSDRGVPSEVISPDMAHEYCPAIDPSQFVAGSYSPTDGVADPHLALQAYTSAAREAGAEIRTQTPVTDIYRDGVAAATGTRRVAGVETSESRLEADYVVNAAGPWAGEVGAMADVSLPIVPKRRQIAVVRPETTISESSPLTIDLESGTYFRPERGDDALVGGHVDDADPVVDPDGYTRSMDFEWAGRVLETVAGWTSAFGPESAIKRGWAGLYAVTPDDNAIIEESVPGFITAGGFSGHGFQHAPATGQLVAELIVDGSASLVDLSAFASNRFEQGEQRRERNVV